jgi:hypothetical protein
MDAAEGDRERLRALVEGDKWQDLGNQATQSTGCAIAEMPS